MIEIETVSTVVEKEKVRSLNDSVGIMLRSYTRAVNKVKNRKENFQTPLSNRKNKEYIFIRCNFILFGGDKKRTGHIRI
jgi:hypothetical protein